MKCDWCEADGKSAEAAETIDGYGFCKNHAPLIQDYIRAAGLSRPSAELSLAKLACDDMRVALEKQVMRSKNLEIVKARMSGMTLARIGAHYKITRERVRQIVKIYGVPSGTVTWKICEHCESKIRPSFTLRGIKLCYTCRHPRVCHRCNIPLVESRKQYCESCQFEERPCGWCGKLVKHRVRGFGNRYGDHVNRWKRAQTWYCSQRCGYYGSHPKKDVGEPATA